MAMMAVAPDIIIAHSHRTIIRELHKRSHRPRRRWRAAWVVLCSRCTGLHARLSSTRGPSAGEVFSAPTAISPSKARCLMHSCAVVPLLGGVAKRRSGAPSSSLVALCLQSGSLFANAIRR